MRCGALPVFEGMGWGGLTIKGSKPMILKLLGLAGWYCCVPLSALAFEVSILILPNVVCACVWVCMVCFGFGFVVALFF